MKNIKLKISVLALFCTCLASAQTSTVSPYSRFGPGEMLFNGYSHQRGMAGTSIADFSVSRLNYANPATYSFDTLMVFEFGLSGEVVQQEQGSLSSTKWNARLEYLAIGFPLIRNRMGLSFGFIPYSGTGYSVASSATLDSTNALTTTFEGVGGYNRYFMGTGIRITKNLSAGVNASYLFGSTEQKRKAEYSNEDFFSSRLRENTVINDFLFEFGLHYKADLKNEYTIAIGATGSLSSEMNANRTLVWENYKRNVFGVDVVRDTISYIEKEKGRVTLPMAMGFGVRLAKGEKWIVQSDVRYQEWSKYRSFKGTDSLDNSYRISVGGQYVADPKGTRGYQRIQYRAGLYYGKSYLNLRNTSLADQGITLGVGLPLRKAYQSMINISLEAGQRGTMENSLIRERYFRAVIGLTFNENWFQKRKYE